MQEMDADVASLGQSRGGREPPLTCWPHSC